MAASRLVMLVSLALSGFAANSLLCRLALAMPDRIDPISFTAIRIASGAIVLVSLARSRARAHADPRGAVALFGYAIAFSLAYVRIATATGALLLFGSVQATMLGTALARGERPGVRTWIGLAIAIAGVVAMVAPGVGAPDPVGAALMVGAGVAWGAYSLLGRGAKDALGATAGSFVLAVVPSIAGLAIGLASGSLTATLEGAALAVTSGALASGLGYAIWYTAMPALGAARAAIVQLLVPVLAALAAIPLLGEPLGARVALAGAVVLGGVALALAPARRTG